MDGSVDVRCRSFGKCVRGNLGCEAHSTPAQSDSRYHRVTRQGKKSKRSQKLWWRRHERSPEQGGGGR